MEFPAKMLNMLWINFPSSEKMMKNYSAVTAPSSTSWPNTTGSVPETAPFHQPAIGGSMGERVYISYYHQDLESVFLGNQDNLEILLDVQHELSQRTRSKAIKLKMMVDQQIQYLRKSMIQAPQPSPIHAARTAQPRSPDLADSQRIRHLQQENQTLKNENIELKQINNTLFYRNNTLIKKNDSLLSKVRRLQEQLNEFLCR